MATVRQPLEPTFASPFYTSIFGIMKLVTDHQLDMFSFTPSASEDYYTTEYNAGGAYGYDASTGSFYTPWNNIGPKYYKYTISSMNYYNDDIKDTRDVYARLRPVELRMPDKKYYDSNRVYLRIGIAKQMLLNGHTETTTKLRTFDGSYNLSNQTNAATDVTTEQAFKAYELPEDVNDNVTYARVNGIRSYLLTPIPLAIDISTGASFEVTMTNEGRLFDYSITAIASNRE